MRFLLTLQPLADRQPLLFNYQYPLMAWIYSRLRDADQAYAAYLHQQGYPLENSLKTFKHFTFSNFILPPSVQKPKSGDPCIRLTHEPIQVIVSFYLDKAAQSFIHGLFLDQYIRLFNAQFNAHFQIHHVESLPDTPLASSIKLQTISPMLVGKTRSDGSTAYLSPLDPDYPSLFALNLIDKYRSIYPKTIQWDPGSASQLIQFRLIRHDRLKSRLLHIKENKSAETEIRAYTNFSFSLTGPEEILKVGYYGGFGKNSANGLGCCKILP